MWFSPLWIFWPAVIGAAAVHVLGVLSDAPVLAGQATAVAFAGLAVIVALGTGRGGDAPDAGRGRGTPAARRGRYAVAAGLGVLAWDAWATARALVGTYLSPFWAPIDEPRPYSFSADLAWLGEALAAQLSAHWPTIVGMLLICGGTAVTLMGQPRSAARWPRRAAWVGVTLVVAIVLIEVDGDGGGALGWLVGLGTLLPTLLALGATLSVLVLAAGRPWPAAVPAALGAILLAGVVLGTDLPAWGPARPEFSDLRAFTQPGFRVTESARADRMVAAAAGPSAVGHTISSLTLWLIAAAALLVLAARPERRRS